MKKKNSFVKHFWRDLVIVFFIAILIAGGLWYLTEEEKPIPMQQYEDMCSEFTQLEGEIPCIRAVQVALVNVGNIMITGIEKTNRRDKNIYIISFEPGVVEIDANTGEIIQMVAK